MSPALPFPVRPSARPGREAPPEPPLVLHLDVDAFFASVEQLLIPRLRGRPVIVGNGVIASCSYQARRFGLRAGMPLHRARQLCPQAVVLDGDYPIYRCFAEHIWDRCRCYTTALETYLDEAYGEATGMERLHGPPLKMGRALQGEIDRHVGLPVSIGLAANRMLAKLASSSAKPHGVAVVPAGQEEAFLTDLPVEKLLGVGPKTARMLGDMNVATIGQFRRLSRSFLAATFGKNGELLYERARGRDPQPLRPNRPPQSISRETSFHQPTSDGGEIRGMLFYLLERAVRTARGLGLQTGTVELTVRYDDWQAEHARRTRIEATDDEDALFADILDMLPRCHHRRVALRHVGVRLTRLTPSAAAGRLFDPPAATRARHIHRAVDDIRDRFGHAAVVSGQSIDLLGKLDRNDYGFVLRTPSLTK